MTLTEEWEATAYEMGDICPEIGDKVLTSVVYPKIRSGVVIDKKDNGKKYAIKLDEKTEDGCDVVEAYDICILKRADSPDGEAE